MTAEILTLVRELDCRVSNGIQVRLLWCEPDDSMWVAVVDMRTRETFRLAVRDGERPRDVFEHPFAYAAVRGIDPESSNSALDTVSSAARSA